MCTDERYQVYELTEINSSFSELFEDTFIESGCLWSSQDLKGFNCTKAKVNCEIPVFPILEIGSLKSAKIVAEISKEYYGVEYFLASALTCDVKGYKDSESIYVDRYHVLPHGDRVDFNHSCQDKINNKKSNYFVVVYSYIFQCLILVCYTLIKIFKKIIKYSRELSRLSKCE